MTERGKLPAGYNQTDTYILSIPADNSRGWIQRQEINARAGRNRNSYRNDPPTVSSSSPTYSVTTSTYNIDEGETLKTTVSTTNVAELQ